MRERFSLKGKLVFSQTQKCQKSNHFLCADGFRNQRKSQPIWAQMCCWTMKYQLKFNRKGPLFHIFWFEKLWNPSKKLLKQMKISGKGTKKLLKSMKIHGNATPNLETAAYLCASYAQPMRELCAKSYHAAWAGWSAGLCSSAAAENIDLWRLFGTLCFRTCGKDCKYT